MHFITAHPCHTKNSQIRLTSDKPSALGALTRPMDEGVKVVRGTKEAQDAAKVAEAEKKLAAKDGRTAGAKYVPPAPKKTVTAGAKPETAYYSIMKDRD